MDFEGIEAVELRREEEEVEFILGALPSIWHNTQNVLRDLGYNRPAVEGQQDQHGGLRHRRAGSHGDQFDDAAGPSKLQDTEASTSSHPVSGNQDEAEEKVCRMCFASEDELGDDGLSIGRLIAPCHCDGSMRYVHDTCLDQWRRQSAASEAARVCGQCHARYRFRRKSYSNLMAFVQASQMLRILACVFVVFLTSFILGVLPFVTLSTIARLEATPLAFVRNAALRQVQLDKTPLNITIHKDKARADVWIPSKAWQRGGSVSMPHISHDLYEKADLQVFARIRQEEIDNPVYWKLVKRPRSTFRANYSDAKIIRSKLRSGENVSRELERLSQGLPLFPLDSWRRSPRQRQAEQLNATAAVNSTSDSSLQTPYNLTPSLRERLIGSDLKLSFGLPFLSSNKDKEAAKEPEEVELWQRQNMTIYWEYEESPADLFPNPSEHFLVRNLPEWLGFLRYVPYGFVLAMMDRFYFIVSVFQPWWSSIARSALQLALLLLESHRELMWCASKALIAGLIAYIDVEYEPVRWNPQNSIVIGPPRTRRRKIAALARELIVVAADSFFGPLWLNWWGGYSLSVYMAPREFMTTERVEMTQLAAVFAPAFTLLIDVAFGGLSTFSKRAARFKKSHTSRWTQADWVHNDYSASEGYRRMIATMIGDKDASQASLWDLWLEVDQARLLPGRTRPLQMALLPKQNTWKTVMLLGCLVTTAIALVVATKLAWDTTISHFARQAWRSLVSIYQLIMHSGDSFRQLWQQTRDISLFIVRYTMGKIKGLVNQLLRSVTRSIPANRDVDAHNAASDPQDTTSSSQSAGGPQGDAQEAPIPPPPEPEPMAEPLLNDPFMQGAHMGIFGAILGHVASIYGCLHAFVFTMRFILVYLPFEPFMIVYTLMAKLIQVDVANTEVLDREDTGV
ncbi:hypothetical protein NDA16_000945 [Ustilago loliicola]|nr:hypothetical protein NDA16_000945 [Ustilago loliicola]